MNGYGREAKKVRGDAVGEDSKLEISAKELLAAAVYRRVALNCCSRKKTRASPISLPLLPALLRTWAGDTTTRRVVVARSAAAVERNIVKSGKDVFRKNNAQTGRGKRMAKKSEL